MMITPEGIKISFSGRPGAGDRAVVARIVGFEAGTDETITRDLVIPAGETIEEPLPHGLYNVQLTLPSGRILQRNVKIDEKSDEVFHFLEDFAPGAGFSLQESSGSSDDDLLTESAVASGNTSLLDYEEALHRSTGIAETGSGIFGSVAGFVVGSVLPTLGLRTKAPRPERPASAQLGIAVGSPPGLLENPPEDGEAWTGQTPAEQRGDTGLWRIPAGTDEPPSADTRRWARVELPDGRIEIASLPLPWFCAGSNEYIPAEVLVDPSRMDGASTTVAVPDKRLAGLLAYLDRGQSGAARPMLEELERENLIERTIFDKMSNPLAACAAAYVGLSVYPPNEREQWDTWLSVCMDRFPGVPDAAIVHARRLILRPDDRPGNAATADALRRAHAAGPPFFSAGAPLLREMLLLLSADHPDLLPLAKEAGQLTARVDQSQVFTVLRYAPPVSTAE